MLDSLSELKDLINLQLLDLSQTNLNGSIPIQGKVGLIQCNFLIEIKFDIHSKNTDIAQNYCPYNIFCEYVILEIIMFVGKGISLPLCGLFMWQSYLP